MQNIPVKKLPHFGELELPKFETAGSAGMDLRAAVQVPVSIDPGERKMIQTGLAVAIPQGFVGQLCSRSGLGAKHGVVVLIAPGLIDSDYRGEILVTLLNTDKRNVFVVARGDRIAQLMISPVFQPTWREVEELTSTERGDGGFGSTGAQ
jgi:dUTP pyrophosphatase